MTAEPARANSAMGTWPEMARIARRFGSYRLRLFASLAVAVVSVALIMVTPLLLRDVIDAWPRHDTRLIAVLCLAMVFAGLLSSALIVGQAALANSVGQQMVHDLRIEVYDRVHSMPLEFFSAESNSEVQARLASDIGGISDIITFTAQSVLTAASRLLAATIVMLILSWPLALLSLLLAVCLHLINNGFSMKRRRLATQRQEAVGQMLKLAGEDLTMTGIVLGRTFGQRTAQRERFHDTSRRISDLTYHQRLAGASGRAIIMMTLTCLPPLIYFVAGTAATGLSLGTVVLLAYMQVQISGPISQLLSINGEFQASLAMFERVFGYLDLTPSEEPAAHDTGAPSRGAAALRPVALDVSALGYRYRRESRDALTDINLSLSPRSVTIIMGATGSGKSTLALLLSGLMAPIKGVIAIDGKPALAAMLQANVTLVPQDGAMLNATIRDNLLFANPSATENELMEALRAAELYRLVTFLPDGLDTMIGERGYEFSGGERQRLALARAMLSDRPVLIIDEATSALDAATADRVHQSLREHYQTRTLVMIAHRVPRLEPSDQLVYLSDGHIAGPSSAADFLLFAPEHSKPPFYEDREDLLKISRTSTSQTATPPIDNHVPVQPTGRTPA